MKERRSSERKRPANYIAVVNRETNEPIGCLVDLTIDGMRIMNNKPIEEGILLKLRITINDSEYVFLDARSRWCKKCEGAEIYEIGLQTQDMTRENLEKINRLMNASVFTESLKGTPADFS